MHCTIWHSIAKEIDSLWDDRKASQWCDRRCVKLRVGKTTGVCNMRGYLLKAGGQAVIHGLDAVLSGIQSDTMPPDWKRGLFIHI